MKTDLLGVDEAIAQIAANVPKMESEEVVLTEATEAQGGRVLAEDIFALLSHPPADVSAMDGYAARHEDLKTLPCDLTMIGESAAGHPFTGKLGKGECVRIFTGAHCPEGADAIIPQENTETTKNSVTIHKAPQKNQYIRIKGNDFKQGDLLAQSGVRLTPRMIALIGSAGHGKVKVRRKPKIAIISTGDELVAPSATPKPHQIISSNGIFLEQLITSLGGEPIQLGIVGDSDVALNQAFSEAKGADLIVTSGGVSVGSHDGVALRMQNSADLIFWRIAMRPGKPLLFGRINGIALLGLPGNPVSTGVCGVIFVGAAIKAMNGQDFKLIYQHAILGETLAANDQRQDFLRASLAYGEDGKCIATAFAEQDSGMMSVFAHADALIMRPPFAPEVEAGDLVPIIKLE